MRNHYLPGRNGALLYQPIRLEDYNTTTVVGGRRQLKLLNMDCLMFNRRIPCLIHASNLNKTDIKGKSRIKKVFLSIQFSSCTNSSLYSVHLSLMRHPSTRGSLKVFSPTCVRTPGSPAAMARIKWEITP